MRRPNGGRNRTGSVGIDSALHWALALAGTTRE